MTDSFHTPGGTEVPAVTADEMRDVDRIAVAEFDLALSSMIENAGRSLAWHVRDVADGPVTVLAGAGGNGGGGLAAARHLHNRGVDVEVVLDRQPAAFEGVPGHQLSVLQHAGVPVEVGPDGVDPATDTAVDAVIGYGLDGAIRGTPAELVRSTNELEGSVVSLDVPSGLDATTGEVPGDAVAPDRVVTLALPKRGLGAVDATLYLADIAIPEAVFEAAGINYAAPFDGAYWMEIAPDAGPDS